MSISIEPKYFFKSFKRNQILAGLDITDSIVKILFSPSMLFVFNSDMGKFNSEKIDITSSIHIYLLVIFIFNKNLYSLFS